MDLFLQLSVSNVLLRRCYRTVVNYCSSLTVPIFYMSIYSVVTGIRLATDKPIYAGFSVKLIKSFD